MVIVETTRTDGRVLTVARGGHDPSLAHGFALDEPVAGASIDGFALEISGWAVPRNARSVCVEIYYRGELLATTGFKERREDIARAFPTAPGAEMSGFGTAIGLVGVSGQFELVVGVLLEDGTRLALGGIYGQRKPLITGFRPTFQPIMLTTIGRSGSTWLSHLLGYHPQIMAYRAFQSESNTLGYWLHNLRVLADPRRYRPPLRGRAAVGWGVHGADPPRQLLSVPDPGVESWLDSTAVERSAALCQQQVDALQQRLADEIGKSDAGFFVEKLAPDIYPWIAWDLYPEAREIMLVRDPRDVYFSALAFNAARGWQAFGRDQVDSDEAFAGRLRQSMLAMRRSLQARGDRVLLVRYEDLVREPQLTLAAILRHLGLAYDLELVRDMLSKANDTSGGFTFHRTTPTPEASIGRWQREVNQALQDACRAAFDDLLPELGYDQA